MNTHSLISLLDRWFEELLNKLTENGSLKEISDNPNKSNNFDVIRKAIVELEYFKGEYISAYVNNENLLEEVYKYLNKKSGEKDMVSTSTSIVIAIFSLVIGVEIGRFLEKKRNNESNSVEDKTFGKGTAKVSSKYENYFLLLILPANKLNRLIGLKDGQEIDIATVKELISNADKGRVIQKGEIDQYTETLNRSDDNVDFTKENNVFLQLEISSTPEILSQTTKMNIKNKLHPSEKPKLDIYFGLNGIAGTANLPQI